MTSPHGLPEQKFRNHLRGERISMMETTDVYGIFPELNDIADADVREKCAAVWRQAFNETGWNAKNIRECPIVLENAECPGNNLEHIRDVAALTMLAYDYMKKKYGDIIRVRRDHLLAAALLHDVGKLYEYKLTSDGPAYSETARRLRHPLKGAILAAAHGLPDEVVHAVGTHSFEGDRSARSAEYYFLRCSDKMAYETITFGS